MSSVNVRKIQTLTGHTDCVYTLEQSAEPHLFFSAAGDGMVVLWDLRDPSAGKLIARLSGSIYALHYMKELDQLVVGHNHDGIHILDWKEKKEVKAVKMTTSAIFDIRSWGDKLYVATGDGKVIVFDKVAAKVLGQISHTEKSARVMAVNPLSQELAVGYSDNAIRVFDLDNLALKYEWYGHKNSVFALSYTPDFKTLLSGSRDAMLKSWDVTRDYGQVSGVAAHLYAINSIAFSPDGKHFVTCSLDKSIKVWQADNLRLLKVIDKSRHAGHGTSVNKLYWSSFDNQLASASDDRTISIWDIIFSQPEV